MVTRSVIAAVNPDTALTSQSVNAVTATASGAPRSGCAGNSASCRYIRDR